MRDGAEMTENGLLVPKDKVENTGLAELAATRDSRLPDI